MNRLIEFFVRKRIFVDLLFVFAIASGIYSLVKIQREFFPNVSFDIVNVRTFFPGSSPDDVEKLITNKIEQDLKEVDGIKKLQSTSVDGLSELVITLDPDLTNEIKGKQDVKDVIDKLEVDLPEDAETPIVTTIDSKQTPIVQLGLSANLEEVELRDLAKKIENEIEDIDGVAKVISSDIRDKEIHVEADPQKLLQYDITLNAISAALAGQNVSIPAGTLEVDPNDPSVPEMGVRTLGEFNNVEDVENTVVRANDFGKSIRVKDLAKVSYGLKEKAIITRVDGKPALNLVVLKKEKADSIRLADTIKEKLSDIEEKYKDSGATLALVQDTSFYVRNRLSVLSSNLGIGLLLVVLILAVLLPGRVALITALGIPVSFLGAMLIFFLMGLSLNVISLLGLIIVVGMLVDDAVVVTDAVIQKMEDGMEPEQAAIEGTKEVWPAVTASVLTTIVAFLPMVFMSGIFGKFIRQIPLGVIIPLALSLIEAFIILPTHLAHYISASTLQKFKEQREKGKNGFWDKKVIPSYERVVRFLVHRRYVGLSIFVGFFALSLAVAGTQMKFILFPPEGVEAFMVRGKTAVGYSLEQTERAAQPLEDQVLNLTEGYRDHVLANIGIHQQDPNDPTKKIGPEYFQYMVFLIPETERDKTAHEIVDDLRANVETPSEVTELVFETVNPGPPVGKAIDVAVRGEDYSRINQAVADLKQMISSIKGTSDISDTYVKGKDEYRFIVNAAEAAAANLSVAEVGQAIRSAIEGSISTSIQELGDQIDVRVSFPKEAREDIESLEKLRIPNRLNQHVRLSSISSIERHETIASYEHQAGQRQVRVQGNVNIDVVSSTEANKRIKDEFMPKIEEKYPGIKLAFGGEDQDTQESMQSLGEAFIFALFGIFLILVWTFGSLAQPLVVLVAVPLGMISAIWALFLHGKPLSFMAMLGIIALGGVIVNNAIVFTDYVNTNRRKGLDRFESIIQAGRHRLRPIFLTTCTTVLGLLPTIYGIGGIDKFVIPIAIVLGWGLAIGSTLTAFAVPTVLSIADDLAELFTRKKTT